MLESLFLSGILLAIAQQAAPPATMLTLDRPVRGEITSDSAIVHAPKLDKRSGDSEVRGQTVLATVPDGVVAISLTSYCFDAYLVMHGPEGQVVAEDDNGLLRTHARL